MKLTPSHGEKIFVTFNENCIRNYYVYLLNGKDEAIEMSRQCNIEVENQCEKYIRSDGCIIYKFGFTQNLCGGTILTAKGISKKFCPFTKKAILFDQNTIFSI